MSPIFVVLLLLSSTGIDPIAGSTLSGDQRDSSPSGGHLASLADLYFVEWVNLQNAGGGLARFDPLYLSSHGHAWNQLRYTVNGLDWTQPMGVGPMVTLPFRAWSAMHYRPIWSSRPELSLKIDLEKAGTRNFVQVRGATPVGGPLFLPPAMMDREPATILGVNPSRRELSSALEVSGLYGLHTDNWRGLLALDYADHRHRYPTLLSESNGLPILEKARSLQILLAGRGHVLNLPVHSLLAVDIQERSHDGAQFRLPNWLTHEKRETGLAATLESPWKAAGLDWVASFVGAYRTTGRTGSNKGSIVSDIENEWLWMARPTTPDDQHQLKLAARLDASSQGFDGVPDWLRETKFSLTASHGQVKTNSALSETILGQTWQRGQTTFGEPVGAFLTHFGESDETTELSGQFRTEASAKLQFDNITIDTVAALDASIGANQHQVLFSHVGDALGLALQWQATPETRVWTLVRREPLAITQSALAFANPNRPAGNRYEWRDNGDRVPTLNEAGELLSRTGGAYHTVNSELKRPMDQVFAFGTEVKSVGPFDFSLAASAHWLLNRYTVRYDPEGEPEYRSTSVHDPGGDGLGEERVAGGGQSLQAYERVVGTEGEELYMLTNADRADLFLGFAIEFKMPRTKRWFVDIAGAAYMAMGSAPMGMQPDRNDPGVVSESSADPNNRLNKRGRYDAGRAFAAHLSMGWMPIPNLEMASILRYRDGQPMTRFLVAQLAQGPTTLMTVRRGEPVPRHTFHMTWDVRMSHTWKLGNQSLITSLDIYNLLGSSTEIIEDNRTGPEFRRSLEMVPHRAVSMAAELSW